MTGVHEAREALGQRLRDLRLDAGLNGRQFAALTGWVPSKVSKIEYGKQTPTDTDIEVWCRHCQAQRQIPDLIATLRNVEAAYMEWRRITGTGIKLRQQQSAPLEAETRLMRWYEPVLVPGLLQTPDYTNALMQKLVTFYDIPDDIEEAVAVRMERQQGLYRGNHRFHFIIAEQALQTVIGDSGIMMGQLDRLLIAMSLPRVVVGIIPNRTAYEVPTTNFTMFDQRLVKVETVAAELNITQPREIALYDKTFQALNQQALYGANARALMVAELDRLRGRLESDEGRA